MIVKHLNILVAGRVQGVFFRASAVEKAHELDVKGFVRNMEDGSVYIEAEAGEEILDRFTAWCKQGPPRSRVDNVAVSPGALKGFTGFELKR